MVAQHIQCNVGARMLVRVCVKEKCMCGSVLTCVCVCERECVCVCVCECVNVRKRKKRRNGKENVGFGASQCLSPKKLNPFQNWNA